MKKTFLLTLLGATALAVNAEAATIFEAMGSAIPIIRPYKRSARMSERLTRMWRLQSPVTVRLWRL